MNKSVWDIDSVHSGINFTVTHMMIAKVHGGFSKFSGILNLDNENLSNSHVKVNIDAASIDTRESKRDEHLRSSDFFDVQNHPIISFESTRIIPNQGKNLQLIGNLTLHGVTKEVVLELVGPTAEIKDPWGNTRIAASATAIIRRKDFGLSWNAVLEAGGLLVGEDVAISLELQFVRKS